MPSKKHPKPPKVRPKVGIAGATNAKKLAISQGYLTAQATNDTQGKLTAEAKALDGARTSLAALLTKQDQLDAQRQALDAAIVVAFADHDELTIEYARAAAKVADGDISVLTTFGVTAAAPNRRRTNDNVGAPEKLEVLPGEADGEVIFKAKGVPYATAYIYEYKLEPSQPTDPWLPPGAIITSH